MLHHAEDDDVFEGKYIPPDLNYLSYGFTEADIDKTFYVSKNVGFKTLREVLDFLRKTYSNTAAIEFMHIPNEEERDYIKNAFENIT